MPKAVLHPIVHVLALTVLATVLQAGPSLAEAVYQPGAMQPVLPPDGGPKPGSPVVDSLMARDKPVLEVRKAPRHVRRWSGRHHTGIARFHRPLLPLERPALAGVTLLQPLPRPEQPPHIMVAAPGYPLDSLVTALTMPAPPIVCHPVRREPGLPDPHLYREKTVACDADNP